MLSHGSKEMSAFCLPNAANARDSTRVAPTPMMSETKKQAMSRSPGVEACAAGKTYSIPLIRLQSNVQSHLFVCSQL